MDAFVGFSEHCGEARLGRVGLLSGSGLEAVRLGVWVKKVQGSGM